MNRKVKHDLTRKAWEKKRRMITVLKLQIFSTDENFKKSPHLFTMILIPS